MAKGLLSGRVAVVAGATRGAGRGIAAALGEQGATVYCTGRSAGGRRATEGRPETLEETAALVSRLGGLGIAVRVDHRVEAEVEALFRRVESEAGRLDVVVNDIWGGDPLAEWGKRFWELDLDKAFRMMRTGIETHITTARYAAPLLVRARKGLLVEVTDGDDFRYRGVLPYDLVKTAVIRLAWDFAEELRPHGVASVCVTPGFLRSEAVLDHFGVTEERWRDAVAKDPNFAESETPRFVGRAVAALAADPRVMERSGRVFASWTLAREYGFTDVDGRRPDWGAHFRRTYGDVARPADEGFYAYWGGYRELWQAMGMA